NVKEKKLGAENRRQLEKERKKQSKKKARNRGSLESKKQRAPPSITQGQPSSHDTSKSRLDHVRDMTQRDYHKGSQGLGSLPSMHQSHVWPTSRRGPKRDPPSGKTKPSSSPTVTFGPRLGVAQT
ncbi:hypothetical protein PIB30_087127, partial [Stylosanthes scabra]|nr:hypothetical protein [Stylosanthes scabra]